jgi:hypothetical protein
MLSALTALVVLVVVLAIFATTKPGRRVAAALGLRDAVAGAATSEDVDFLLGRCKNDPIEVARRVEAERERFPDLCEADHYRRAIRRLLGEANAGTASRAGNGGEPEAPARSSPGSDSRAASGGGKS